MASATIAASAFWGPKRMISGRTTRARVNTIRTRTLIERADIVVVRFGDKYKQWNAAFDAGFAAALGKCLITLHEPSLTHALKEVDGAALAVASTPEQVVSLLRYVSLGELSD